MLYKIKNNDLFESFCVLSFKKKKFKRLHFYNQFTLTYGQVFFFYQSKHSAPYIMYQLWL